jgi:hypothetical protein
MNLRTSLLLLIGSVFLLLPACEKEQELLDEDVYGKVLIELTIVNQMDEAHLGDSSREELRDQIYNKYNVTRELFRVSHDVYQRDMENQMRRVEEYSRILRAERDTVQQLEREYRLEVGTRSVQDSLRTIPGAE